MRSGIFFGDSPFMGANSSNFKAALLANADPRAQQAFGVGKRHVGGFF